MPRTKECECGACHWEDRPCPRCKKGEAVKNPDKPSAFVALTQAINSDPEYAWGWHCNLAMPIKDEIGCSHLDANKAAARIMQTIFSVDTTKNKYFPGNCPAYPKQ